MRLGPQIEFLYNTDLLSSNPLRSEIKFYGLDNFNDIYISLLAIINYNFCCLFNFVKMVRGC
jgi:hypothetical protein